MLSEIFNVLKDSLAVLLVGLVIKLTDDYLDQLIDKDNCEMSLSVKLKEAVLPYCLLIYSIALLLNYQITLAFFLAAYIVGMFSDLNRPLSFGLKGYQECLLVSIISIGFLGFRLSLLAVIIMLIIQVIDDFIDLKMDKNRGSNNLVAKFGKIETGIALVILLCFALYLSVYYSVISLFVYPFISRVLNLAKGGYEQIC